MVGGQGSQGEQSGQSVLGGQGGHGSLAGIGQVVWVVKGVEVVRVVELGIGVKSRKSAPQVKKQVGSWSKERPITKKTHPRSKT